MLHNLNLFSFLGINLKTDPSVAEEAESGVYEELAKEAPEETNDNVLGMPLINGDFYELAFRFGFTLLILFIIIRLIYYPTTRRKDYLFTYLLISIITFLICYTLQNNKIKLGLALGLFAVFGIIRYRTDAIAIKEMTYLFVVIGLSVINALSNDKVSWAELVFTNFVVIAIVYGLEKIWLLKHEHSKIILYEKIDLIKPEKRSELKADLETRTGLKINRVSIGKIDFLKDVAQVIIFYYEVDQPFSDPSDNSDDDDD